MKINPFFTAFFLLLVVHSSAQTQVSGHIIEKSNQQKTIPNAVVVTSQQRYFFSDLDGAFSFQLKEGESVQKIIGKGYKVLDQPQPLSTLELSLESSSDIEEISSTAIQMLSDNQYADTNFKFKTISKTKITNSEIDFILRKSIKARLTTQEGLQQHFELIKVDGLDAVVPKMLNKDIFSLDWFTDYAQVFDIQFVSPFHRLTSQPYAYHSLYENSKVHIINFTPLKKGFQRSLSGVFILDKQTSRIQQLQLNTNEDFAFNAVLNFDLETGLPKTSQLSIYPGQGGIKLSFFGGGMSFGKIQDKNPTTKATLHHQLLNYNITASDSISPYPNALSKRVDATPKTHPEEYWTSFDAAFMQKNDEKLDERKAYIEKEHIERRVKRISAFEAGYLPVGVFDIDLTRLFKINNYEGVRLGLGVLTNQSFSESYRLGAFTAYGTQDGNFKYGFNAGALLNSDKASWFNVFYDNDIEEVGMNNFLTDQRVYSLFEPRLVNITFFYKYQKYGFSVQHNFTPQLMSEFKLEKNKISQTRAYAFLNDEKLYDNYELTLATFGVRWTPNHTFSKVGKRIYTDDETTPEISAQISQSFRNVMEGDFNFTKLSAKIDYDLQHSWGSVSSIELGGDIGFGDMPLMHTFHTFPNSPNKENILNRFSVAGVKSFETMYFNEFFSTKLATLHLKHRLAAFRVSNTIQPELVLISRHAIGDFDHPEQHQDISFGNLSKGYNEAGFELNKLFFGFGLSFAYRYGAYHLPNLEDNISAKFTFYLKL